MVLPCTYTPHMQYFSQALQIANNSRGVTVDRAMQSLIQEGTVNTTDVLRCYMEQVWRLLPMPSEDQGAVDLRRVRGLALFGLAAVHEAPIAAHPEYLGFNNDTRFMIGEFVWFSGGAWVEKC